MTAEERKASIKSLLEEREMVEQRAARVAGEGDLEAAAKCELRLAEIDRCLTLHGHGGAEPRARAEKRAGAAPKKKVGPRKKAAAA